MKGHVEGHMKGHVPQGAPAAGDESEIGPMTDLRDLVKPVASGGGSRIKRSRSASLWPSSVPGSGVLLRLATILKSPSNSRPRTPSTNMPHADKAERWRTLDRVALDRGYDWAATGERPVTGAGLLMDCDMMDDDMMDEEVGGRWTSRSPPTPQPFPDLTPLSKQVSWATEGRC